MKKLYAIFFIYLLLFSCQEVYSNSLVKIPQGGQEVIDLILNEPVKEMVSGKTGYAINDGLKIWYESINPQGENGTVLLLAGAGGTAVAGLPLWLIEGLISKGYNVIRFDYRETGQSDMVHNWSIKNYYTLEDMGRDAVAVLDANNIDKAHIIGISMGGMVSQTISIEFPDRVKSVTSLVSTGYMLDYISEPDLKEVEKFSSELKRKYPMPVTQRETLEVNLAYLEYFKGKESRKISKKDMYDVLSTVYYDLVKIGDWQPIGPEHHNMAVFFSGSRLDKLKEVKTPYLVIHGTSDNFVRLQHAKKYSSSLENCETLWIKGMGHSLGIRKDGKKIMRKLIPFLNKHN